MLTSIPVSVAVGITLGFLAGLGIGGGSLLMLWLTLIVSMEHTQARQINLIFFAAAAGIVSLIRKKQGALPVADILPAMISGCIATAVTTLLSKEIDVEIIKKLFGGLLLLTGVKELFYRPKKAK